MDLSSLFLENPLPVYVVLALVEAVLLGLWRWGAMRWARTALVVPVALAAAVALVAHFVKTDREQIAEVLDEIASGAQAGSLEPARAYLDPALKVPAPGMVGLVVRFNREQFLERARTALATYPIRSAEVTHVQTSIAGANATSIVETHATIEFAEYRGTAPFNATWKLQWAKRPEGWRIVRLEVLSPARLANWNF